MKKLLGLIMAMIFSVAVITGCTNSNNSTSNLQYGESAAIKIAVLGSNEQFAARRDFLIGMDLAINELRNQGIDISYEKIDDGSSRDSGVALAKDVATNNSYTLALTLQTNETVDVVASIFEDAKKPLIIIDECYDSTMNKGYEYLLSGVISAEDAGKALVEYCEKNNIKWVSTVHSQSQYEKTLAKSFGARATSSSKTQLLDSTGGISRKAELMEVLGRWDTLGIDAALVSFDDIDWTCEVIEQIKAINKDMLIFGHTGLNDIRYLEKYKDVLEGVIVSGSYTVDSEESLQAFYDKYEKKVMDEQNFDITSVTAEGYDIANLIAIKVKESSSASDFMSKMKSSEGYAGVTGIKFKANGQIDEQPSYWIVRDGQMYRMK